MVGVTSPLSPGATYALVGLEAIGRALQDGTPLLLFVDDPALDKTRSGAASALRDPDRLYSHVPDEQAGQSDPRTRTPGSGTASLQAVEMLAGEYWPTTLLPMHPWGSAAIAGEAAGGGQRGGRPRRLGRGPG